jgi:hypothetical protein
MSVLVLAILGLVAQDPGQWQDFGAGADGARVSLNLDSVESAEQGPEAMVRVRFARPAADGAVQIDYRSVFDCSARSVARFQMGELTATGEIVARSDEGLRAASVQAPAGTPMGKVLDLVCSMAAG